MRADERLVDFYESVLPGDTVFKLEIDYKDYENYWLNCLEAPLFKYVQELTIHGCYQDVPRSISKLKNLTALHLHSHCDGLCEDECPIYIPNEVYHLPNLEVLSINTKNTIISDSIIHLKKLKHLNIASTSLYPFLFTDMPQLKSIAINNIYTSKKELHKVVLNKLLIFSYYTPQEFNMDTNYYGVDYNRIINELKETNALNEKVDLKIKNPDHKNEIVFEIKGEFKNNKPIGKWFVGSDYTLNVNYINGIKESVEIRKEDTVLIGKITKEQDGTKTYVDKRSNKKTKNNIPVGIWEYGAYNSYRYYKINFGTGEPVNFKNTDTSGFFSWKVFKNEIEDGTWKDFRGNSKYITEFKNGMPVNIVQYDYRFKVPISKREFYYMPDNKIHIILYLKSPDHKLYKYSEETYRNYSPDGIFTTYYPDGSILKQQTFENGYKIDKEIEYGVNKKPVSISTYNKGILIHQIYFHFNGVKSYEASFNKNGIHGNENKWNGAGELIETTYYNNGKAFGIAQKFDGKGNVIFESYHDNGYEIYNEERGFDKAFIYIDALLNLQYCIRLSKNCCYGSDRVIHKTIINDSTFLFTEHLYSQVKGRHLHCIKEYRFKNYQLDGMQLLKDSAGNIIQSVAYKMGKKHGRLTSTNVSWKKSVSFNYTNDILKDTILIYSYLNRLDTTIHYYKNTRVYKAIITHYNKDTIMSAQEVIEYDRGPVSIKSGKRINNTPMFFIPKKATIYTNNKPVEVYKFSAWVSEIECTSIRRVNGHATINGKREKFVTNKETNSEYWFKCYSIFNVFYDRRITCRVNQG